MERHLDWEGCWNVRDLGGLRTVDGRITRSGRVVRGDALDQLTDAGWEALVAHGVRTVIDLRGDDERHGDVAQRPETVATLAIPLDGSDDRAFWNIWASGPQFGTPLYYRPHLERMPERSAAVLRAIADAPEGGVAYHCGGGRDRVGQITMLLLALVGVTHEDIAADYALSAERLTTRAAATGEEDQEPALSAYLAEQGTTATAVLEQTLADFDVRAVWPMPASASGTCHGCAADCSTPDHLHPHAARPPPDRSGSPAERPGTRRENMADNGRVIVSCTNGAENPDGVIVSYLTAGAALDAGKDVVLWLTSEGVRLALRGYVDPIREGQEPPVKRVHEQFIEKGGRFYVCPVCFNDRELDEADLVDNAEIKGATPLMEFAGEGAMTFSY